MTVTNVPTSDEMIERLRSTERDPFVLVTPIPQESEQQASHSVEAYERLRRQFDASMRADVSLRRMAAAAD